MINTVNLIGYAEKHPELKYFESGKILCKLSLVVELHSDSNELIDLEFWNKKAKIAATYVHQGRLIGVTGSLKLSQWRERKTGIYRQEPVILVRQLYLLGSKAEQLLFSTSDNALQPTQIYEESRTVFNEYEYEYEYEYECDDSYIQVYDQHDTSMDYGYLDDLNSIYEHFYSFGEFD